MFGAGAMTNSIPEIRDADMLFVIGSNTTEAHPIIAMEMKRAVKRGAKLVVADPRAIWLADIADLHMQLEPGTDVWLLNAMAHVIIKEKRHNTDFMDKKVQFKIVKDGKPAKVGFDGYVKFLEDFSPDRASRISGVPADTIIEAARLFTFGPTMSFWTMGLNQRTTGVWANNLIHNLHLITGQIGKPGATPFSLTGQPNACGGVRDTGSLCHILPYGRLVKKEGHRKEMEKLWGSKPGTIKSKPGLHTVEMFRALGREEVKAMLVLTTNPAHSLPNMTPHCKAIAGKPFVVVLDIFPTLTTQIADLVLPAAMWSEKDGVFGMSERRYQYQPKVKKAPGEARPDLDVLLDFGTLLEKRGVIPDGYVSKKFKNSDDVWNEMRLASKNTAYDFMGMTRERLKKERGVRWPAPTVDHPGTARRFVKGDDPCLDKGPYADHNVLEGDIKFYAAPDARATVWLRPAKPPAEPVDKEYPYILSTGRVLEHWHTGTMTMKAEELRRAQPECFVEVNPVDAKKLGIRSGNRVKITSRRGVAIVKARVVGIPRPGMVFVPMHWEDKDSQINRVTIDAFDPGSKQPEFKICAVKLAKA